MAKTAAELVAAMEAGKRVRRVVTPNVKVPEYVELSFRWWDAGRQRTVLLQANFCIRPMSRSNWRTWLAEMVELPEQWEVVDG